MNCMRCGIQTPRLRINQRYCPTCEREVEQIVKLDTERRRSRFGVNKDLTGAIR